MKFVEENNLEIENVIQPNCFSIKEEETHTDSVNIPPYDSAEGSFPNISTPHHSNESDVMRARKFSLKFKKI